MKNFGIGLVVGLLAIASIAAVLRQSSGIYILNETDEIQLKIRKTGSNQTAPWLEVVDADGTLKFSIPVTVGTATITNLIASVATNRLVFVNGLLISSTAL